MAAQGKLIRDDAAARLQQLLGRSDTDTEQFLADCERALAAWARARGSALSRGLPADIAMHLRQLEAQLAALRSSLYQLPQELTALVDLHLLGADLQTRIRHDLAALALPLEDLGAALKAAQGGAESTGSAGEDLRTRLLRAIGNAYRNCFNLLPVLDPRQPFTAVLRLILETAAQQDSELAELLQAQALPMLEAVFGRGGDASTQPLELV